MAASTDGEQGRRSSLLGNPTNHTGRLPHGTLDPATQTALGSGFAPILPRSTEAGSTLTAQPPSIPKPITCLDSLQTPLVRTGQPILPSSTTPYPKLIWDSDKPRPTKRTNQAEKTAPADPTASAATRTTLTAAEDSKAWASRQVQSFRSEIETLSHNNATRSATIGLIEREIEDIKKEDSRVKQAEEEETARVLKEIQDRYAADRQALSLKLSRLVQSKQLELEGLKRNELQVTRKEKGLLHWQAIVDYYNTEA